jgi:PAB-dependent poly(A)-specific ribonuclease subunit 2
VVDTVELFHLPGQRYWNIFLLLIVTRKISLRFLASILLNTDIQADTHCSIEDARTVSLPFFRRNQLTLLQALNLFTKYEELFHENKFTSTLLKIYELGRQTKWGQPDPLNL